MSGLSLQEYLHQNCRKDYIRGLARMEAMAEILGQPQQRVPAVHIAGTNGKGSCTAMLGAVLTAAGYRVGMYTSPHLQTYTERIRINDQLIADEHYRRIMWYLIEEIIPQIRAQGLDHPSEFELLTMTAFLYFAHTQPDIVLYEVGMGGRLDSTNILRGQLSIIMSIGLDHCQSLGDTAEAIAREKAGIMKPGVPVVSAMQSEPGVEAVFRARAREVGAPFTQVGRDCYTLEAYDENGQRFALDTGRRRYEGLFIRLLGRHQVENAAAVVIAAEKLAEMGWAIDEAAIRQGLAQARWPGRMEYWPLAGQNQGILMDGAHNDPGAAALVDALEQYFPGRPKVMLLGILDDKDQRTMLSMLLPHAERVIITQPADKRAEHWRQMADLIGEIDAELPVEVVAQAPEAIDRALALLPPDGVLCITGSLYLLGDCRGYLLQKRREHSLKLKEENV